MKTYVGHFSFYEKDETRYGYFTLIAKATNIEAALDKFTTLMLTIRADQETDVLDDIDEIYLDNCVEISKMPADGALMYFQSQPADCSGSISMGPLVLGDENQQSVAGYHQRNDEDMDKPEEEPTLMPVFLKFNVL